MLKSKKFAVLAAAMVVIMICSAVPTFSWLSATSDPVVNTFNGGTIVIKLDEAHVGTDGKAIEDDDRVSGNNYKYTAGAVLDKDPTATVYKGSDPCYVFAYVDNELTDKFTMDYKTDYWKKVATSGTSTLYVYKSVVDASTEDKVLEPVFTTVTVSKDLEQADIEALGKNKTVTVQSYAVQSDGVTSTAAIDMAVKQFMPDGTTATYVDVATA